MWKILKEEGGIIQSDKRTYMKRAILFALLFSALSFPALTAQVRQVGLGEMIGAAGMIFAGTVTDVRGETDENGDIVTRTTFRVESPIRGVLPGSVTIKQFGGKTDKGMMYLEHMRYFVEGERVLVMLYPPSDLGFTSPIGMGQGAWTVSDQGNVQGIAPDLLKDLKGLPAQYGVKPGASRQVPLANLIALIGAVTGGGK